MPFPFMNRLFLHLLILVLPLTTYAANSSNYNPTAIYLTWQRSPESTMTICWLTPPKIVADKIEYQREGETFWHQAIGTHKPLPENAPYLLHTVELTNLHPSTNYFFRTNSQGDTYKFQTMPSTLEKPLRFVVGGDMYHDTVDKLLETNRQAAKTGALFALIGGDIAYAANKKTGFLPSWTNVWIDRIIGQKFERWLTWLIAWSNEMVTPDGRLIPMLPVLGNHDVSGGYGQTPKEAPFFYSFFAMPGTQGYNVLDFGNYMSIFLLDSGHTHPVEGRQTQWLAKNLELRRMVPNKFAIYHVPAYPSVRDMNQESCSTIRKNWVPLFDEFRLTAAFEHHDHDYKRTFPLTGGKIDPQGVIYLGDGAWGVDEPREMRHPSQKWYLEKTLPARHFIMVELRPDHRRIEAISSKGALLDEIEW